MWPTWSGQQQRVPCRAYVRHLPSISPPPLLLLLLLLLLCAPTRRVSVLRIATSLPALPASAMLHAHLMQHLAAGGKAAALVPGAAADQQVRGGTCVLCVRVCACVYGVWTCILVPVCALSCDIGRVCVCTRSRGSCGRGEPCVLLVRGNRLHGQQLPRTSQRLVRAKLRPSESPVREWACAHARMCGPPPTSPPNTPAWGTGGTPATAQKPPDGRSCRACVRCLTTIAHNCSVLRCAAAGHLQRRGARGAGRGVCLPVRRAVCRQAGGHGHEGPGPQAAQHHPRARCGWLRLLCCVGPPRVQSLCMYARACVRVCVCACVCVCVCLLVHSLFPWRPRPSPLCAGQCCAAVAAWPSRAACAHAAPSPRSWACPEAAGG